MRIPAPATNVRADFARRPKWMGRAPKGPACIRLTRPRPLGGGK